MHVFLVQRVIVITNSCMSGLGERAADVEGGGEREGAREGRRVATEVLAWLHSPKGTT